MLLARHLVTVCSEYLSAIGTSLRVLLLSYTWASSNKETGQSVHHPTKKQMMDSLVAKRPYCIACLYLHLALVAIQAWMDG